ncbi:hypothetical protein Spb1_36770 [Planctopirus ephydatiae]|jgi:putative membrane protein|uniref:DUF202 domain-containing protein n=1 Tax=Planctopirus ephydatiae TaxID=2528019 RepID=A0A518GT14_9PLAN|nr:DUF202 domain-containing protein [Planctopirus ephydatiae]QDV31732.1 hypothetical protein Spb1_36770 [Planctopirus ephydatiae]
MSEGEDPRVYFAAERTLLAWIRTGLAIVGMGFVLARFGVFLQLLHRQEVVRPGAGSWLGLGMVALGAWTFAIAGWQHFRFVQSLSPQEKPRTWGLNYGLVLAGALSLISLLLAAYLLLSQGEASSEQVEPPKKAQSSVIPALSSTVMSTQILG